MRVSAIGLVLILGCGVIRRGVFGTPCELSGRVARATRVRRRHVETVETPAHERLGASADVSLNECGGTRLIDEDRRLHVQVAAAFLLFAMIGVAYFAMRAPDSVNDVRVVTAEADMSRCTFVTNLAVPFKASLEMTRTPKAELRDAELIMRQRALAAGADTIRIAVEPSQMTSRAYRCR